MRKLLVTCDYPPITGGQASYFSCIWSNLNSENCLLLVPKACKKGWKGNVSQVRFMPIASGENWPARITRFILLTIHVLKACVAFKPEEIQFGQFIVGGLCGILIKFIRGTEFICFCHGTDILEFSRNGIGRIIVKKILRSCKKVAANSTFTAQSIRQIAPAAVEIINPGVDTKFFSHNAALTEQLYERFRVSGTQVILTAGRLVERKGHDAVIKALPLIAETVPDIHYVIVGDGPYRKPLEKIAAESAAAGRVTFCGKVSDEELCSYYRLAKIFIMVPRYLIARGDIEGFGIVYLEANAAGLPVIAAKSGGVEDAVQHGENGLLVTNPESIEEISTAVCTLLTDAKLHATLSAQALKWAQQRRCHNAQNIWAEKL